MSEREYPGQGQAAKTHREHAEDLLKMMARRGVKAEQVAAYAQIEATLAVAEAIRDLQLQIHAGQP